MRDGGGRLVVSISVRVRDLSMPTVLLGCVYEARLLTSGS
jgi:hypothetical protein